MSAMTCPADRHGPWAYWRHGCRCPHVVEHMRARWRAASRRRRAGELRWRGHVDVDPVAVERACGGEAMPLGITERREAVARLDRYGLSAAAIADRLGISERTVCRWRRALRQAANLQEPAA